MGLDLEDINVSSRVVRVRGKGGKERLVPFNRTAAGAIRTYLKDRQLLVKPGPPAPRRTGDRSVEPLFVNYRVVDYPRVAWTGWFAVTFRSRAPGRGSAHMRSVIRLPPTCSSVVPTFGRSRSCSATPA